MIPLLIFIEKNFASLVSKNLILDELAQDKDKEGSSLEKGPESCSQKKGAEGSCQVEGDREVILSELQAAISQVIDSYIDRKIDR